MTGYLLEIDFGTGGAKACIINDQADVLSYSFREYEIITDAPGWSEHDAVNYWEVACDGARDIVHKVSKDLKSEHAAIIEPLSCAVHTIERADIKFNDVVVIAGMGPIGLCKLQLAKLKNPRLLIGIDMKDSRLEIAKKLGADIVLNPGKCNTVEEVRKLTNGYGCDVYIHNSGHPSGVIQGLDMIRKMGTFVEFSVFGAETSVDWSVIGDRKELDIRGSHISGQHGYEVAINLLEKGVIKVDDIVTHQFALKDWKTAFDMAYAGNESIKVVLKPDM